MDSPTESIARISPFLYHDLVHYFRYASSAYTAVCPRPNGQHLVFPLINALLDTQGYIARDDGKKELVLALRGSTSIQNILLDAQIIQVPFISPGVASPLGTKVHSGFLVAWDSHAIQVIEMIRSQLEKHPEYELVTTGHSLGGALSTLAAISLKHNFPETPVRCYTYGAPRVGNQVFADFVNAELGDRFHRVVNKDDGVPTIIPREPLGYSHNGVEYWHHSSPPTHENVKRCDACGEDKSCSGSIPSQGVNDAHMEYFGIIATTPFCI